MSTPERAKHDRKRNANHRVVAASLELSGQKYHPVPDAFNVPTLSATVKEATGMDIKRGVATRIVANMENDTAAQHVLEFARLPSVFESLRQDDPQVRALLCMRAHRRHSQ